MGGGSPQAGSTSRTAPRSSTPLPLHHPAPFHHPRALPPPPRPSTIPAPPPSFLRRQEPGALQNASAPPSSDGHPHAVVSTSASLSAAPPPHPHLLPNSSLPPLRGEVRWGVEAFKPTPPVVPPPDRPRHSPSTIPVSRHHPRAPSVIPAQAGTRRAPKRHSAPSSDSHSHAVGSTPAA